MISNQILQNTIDGLKGITRTDLCVIDVEGKILAATFPRTGNIYICLSGRFFPFFDKVQIKDIHSDDDSHCAIYRIFN